ncbi:hypothetical protein [Streptomyces sp. B1-3]|uniref:hypothetical protein n=1 Tax=Streptomyces sp. B1-3 TaxID=3141453 RepID=UPI003D2E69CB
MHALIHVLGYRDTAGNLADGPNAMLLHVPTAQLTPGQFLSAGRTGDVLRRMVDAVEPVAAGAHDIAWKCSPRAGTSVRAGTCAGTGP